MWPLAVALLNGGKSICNVLIAAQIEPRGNFICSAIVAITRISYSVFWVVTQGHLECERASGTGQLLGQKQVIKQQPPGLLGVALAARRGAAD